MRRNIKYYSKLARIMAALLLCNVVFSSCSVYNKYSNQFNSETDIKQNNGTSKENVQLSFEEQAKVLSDLGITGLTDEVITGVKEDYEQYPDYPIDPYLSLLGSIGYGDYDYETYAWTPTSTEVYGFDTEVFNLEKMYTDFINGIISISKNEFSITNIEENLDEVDFENGTGIQSISFKYNDHSYLFKGKVNNDWIDCRIIDFMNDIFEKEKNPKRLLCTLDGGQGYFLFYNSLEWAKEFTQKTNIPLSLSYKYNKYIKP